MRAMSLRELEVWLDKAFAESPPPLDRSIRMSKGTILHPPADWSLLPPGDAALTRRVKAAGPTWTVQQARVPGTVHVAD